MKTPPEGTTGCAVSGVLSERENSLRFEHLPLSRQANFPRAFGTTPISGHYQLLFYLRRNNFFKVIEEEGFMDQDNNSRRNFLLTALAAGSAFALSACDPAPSATANKTPEEKDKKPGEEKEVTAAEDLMREHGILRRALLIYGETAGRLRRAPNTVSPDALNKTAKLFRAFGEDYHEKKLEEAYIFPVVRQKGGPAASYPDILTVQHTRGRELTDHIISVTNSAKLGANAAAFADALDAFVRMYENHAAREDTIVFPAWKDAVTDEQYKELSEKFEEIEHEQFGRDGFDYAVDQISNIEASLGLADISQFTIPAVK
jgi:hemerythrin-like domain-containing protein